ncbi:hypothetical protein AYO20_03821 [Fonsecaea nubica]|uniref:Xylanolytic transcriptional activator regulatory domain-containing protein n=1 Tax=Fonsecaea nubica TaxID=856822 RepID=A0A178D4U4_9EURO|nr:hypothetical protein AYO20_03821 [Fonsecaea nubica]OAL36766.1 hypothetical protein AYO20_03821 [Fonsecaea nubica]
MDFEARLARLEKAFPQQAELPDGDDASPSAGSDWLSPSVAQNDRSSLLENDPDQMDEAIRGGTSARKTIADLDQLIPPDKSVEQPAALNHCPFARWNAFPDCCERELLVWTSRMNYRNHDQDQNTLRRYFTFLNPHYPCLNESRFFSDLQTYSTSDISTLRNREALQFVALVYLLVALMKILEDYCTESSAIPGWQEFNRASHLLSHNTHMGRGDVQTANCFIIKALYLLYIEEYNASYEAVSQAVRLCYQNGLNRQSTWKDCTPFEVHMRQRIFWSIYCLDRTVAQVSGMPYLLRDTEHRVDLPAAVNDQMLNAGDLLPEETPEHSASPYQHNIVRWGQLSAEVWDKMYGLNAESTISDEYVVTMDARLILLRDRFPKHLQWRGELSTSPGARETPRYIVRQAYILHLRVNHLRLLLQRQSMVGSDFRQRAAEICLPIASDSIMTIYNTHFSSLHQELERYSSITYLTGAMIPVACIILKGGPQNNLREDAISLYQKAMMVFQDVSSGFALARAMLKRLRRIVSAVELNIRGRDKTATASQTSKTFQVADMDTNMGNCLELNQYSANMFDLLYDATLDAPLDDAAILEFRSFDQFG